MFRFNRPATGSTALLGLVILVGLNLRPFLTATGPLAAAIRADTGMTLPGMALLTLVPMGLMGVLAFAGPSVQAAIGARPAMIGALAAMAAGSFARLFASSPTELVATAVILGIGVAIVQAVFPGILKHHFSGQIAVVMGLYSAMLMGGGAIGARVSPVIADMAGGWRWGLGWLTLPAVAAAVAASLILPRGEAGSRVSGSAAALLFRRPRTWLLMACFGLVNGGYSTAIAWLAPFYQERGWSTPASGGLLAAMALSQAGAALLLPILARRGRDRRAWLWFTLTLQATGFLGLIVAPDLAPMAWAICLGAGLGANFAFTMIVALDHLDDPSDAGALAALMQGGGFLLAAIPPWVVAVLHDRTGGFTGGWVMHCIAVATVVILTVRLAPRTYADAVSLSGQGFTRRSPRQSGG